MTGRWWIGALVAVVFGSGCSKKTTLDTGLRDYEGAPSVSDTDTGDETESDDPETDTDTGVDTDTGETPVVDDWDEDGFSVAEGDCNDGDGSIFPGATEVCNQRDDNCDGEVDEGIETTDWHEDYDADGYGSIEVIIAACAQPGGYVADGTDCDDWDPRVYPGAEEESGDDTDANCDGWLHDYRECVEDETIDAVMYDLSAGRIELDAMDCRVDAEGVEVWSDCSIDGQSLDLTGLNVNVESTSSPLVFETTVEVAYSYEGYMSGEWDCTIEIQDVDAIYAGTVFLDVYEDSIEAVADFDLAMEASPASSADLSGVDCPESLDWMDDEAGVPVSSDINAIILSWATIVAGIIEDKIEVEFIVGMDCPTE
jgi:hypothetical protein